MRLLAAMVSRLRQLSLFDPPEPVLPDGLLRAPDPEKAGTKLRVHTDSGAPSHAAAIPPVAGRLPQVPFDSLLHGPFAHIEVFPKPRLHESWRVSWIRRREALRLEIPVALADAPQDVKVALLDWALLVSRRGRKSPDERRRRAELERTVRQALHAPGDSPAARRQSARDARRLDRIRPKGEFHDLGLVFAAVNARYFEGALAARITWSARLGGLSTHTIARDGDGRQYHLITISRGYDDPEVTPEILGGVVYHESLHIAIPPRESGGRRIVHGADFRARERRYEHYDAWRKWHREGLPRALRRLRRRMKAGKGT